MGDLRGVSLLFEFFRTSQRVRLLVGDAMAGCGLRPDEYAVYSVLVDFGPSSPKRMAQAVGMPPTTMSHYVRAMVERGHVVRRPDRRDRRAAVLTLTQAGRAAHAKAGSAFELGNSRFRQALTGSEAAVRRSLRDVAHAAEVARRDLAGGIERAG